MLAGSAYKRGGSPHGKRFEDAWAAARNPNTSDTTGAGTLAHPDDTVNPGGTLGMSAWYGPTVGGPPDTTLSVCPCETPKDCC